MKDTGPLLQGGDQSLERPGDGAPGERRQHLNANKRDGAHVMRPRRLQGKPAGLLPEQL